MFITKDQEQKRLLTAWRQLGKDAQRTVCLFAEFLGQQALLPEGEEGTPVPQTPLAIPKPDKESAVLALKRLKKSYPMIEADMSLLEEASQLLLKKVMGQPDAEVIAALETLFDARYQAWKKSLQPSPPAS